MDLSPFSSPSKKKKKNKKKKKHDIEGTPVPPPQPTPPPLSTPVTVSGKKKKRKTSMTSDLESSSFDLSFQSSPKKKKKSSKKKENEPIVEGVSKEGNISILLSEAEATPRSAKKKQNHNLNVSVASEMNSDENTSFSTPGRVGSTKKSSKKKKHKENGDLDESKTNLEGDVWPLENGDLDESKTNLEGDVWPLNEEYLLIDVLLEKLDPDDTTPYNKMLRQVDWKSLAINDRSPESCEQKLLELLVPVVKLKSLAEVLKEARELASDEKKRQRVILSAQRRFIRKFFEEHKGEGSLGELSSRAAEMWKTMSSKEKLVYETKEAMALKHYKKLRDYPPEPPQSPFQYYLNIQKKKGKITHLSNRTQLLTAFTQMDIKDKGKYIKMCMKDWIVFKQDFDRYMENHSDFQEKFPKLSNRPLFEKYLRYLGMPKGRSNNACNLFYNDLVKKGKLNDVEPKQKLMLAGKLYKEISKEEKQKYGVKFAKEKEKYQKKYAEWWEEIDEDIKAFVDTIFKPKKILLVKEKKAIAKKPKTEFTFTNVQEMVMAKPKFPDEPEKPPLSPYAIFLMKFEKLRREKYSSIKEMKEACRQAWFSMSKDKKAKYVERQKEYLGIYKEKLLDYVKEIGSAKSLFIGLKRKPLYQLFKEDIFENDYPNADYPVYVFVKKEVGALNNVMKLEELEKLNNESKTKGMGLVDDSDSCKDVKMENHSSDEFDVEEDEQMEIPKEEDQDEYEEEDEDDEDEDDDEDDDE